jgi:long-chain fatty acid transport protein
LRKRTQVLSGIFSCKLNQNHSLGLSLDYFFLSYNRGGNQNADNLIRSVSPGNVTNNGTDHSSGFGISLGWHWKITQALAFGLAWIKKSYVGQFKKYQGFEPHQARNYIPHSIGGGFEYLFSPKIKGRLECLWIHYAGLPGANSAILPNGELNRNKRGSNKSPGPGLQDATFINLGAGYLLTKDLAMGIGFSHRIKPSGQPNILAHTYKFQTIFDQITFGTNYKYKKHDFFLTLSRGFKNKVQGSLPAELGGGRLAAERSIYAAFFSWGYLY